MKGIYIASRIDGSGSVEGNLVYDRDNTGKLHVSIQNFYDKNNTWGKFEVDEKSIIQVK